MARVKRRTPSADRLSDGQLREAFWGRGQVQATGQRPYRRAG
jgi:hypothetical protein